MFLFFKRWAEFPANLYLISIIKTCQAIIWYAKMCDNNHASCNCNILNALYKLNCTHYIRTWTIWRVQENRAHFFSCFFHVSMSNHMKPDIENVLPYLNFNFSALERDPYAGSRKERTYFSHNLFFWGTMANPNRVYMSYIWNVLLFTNSIAVLLSVTFTKGSRKGTPIFSQNFFPRNYVKS